MKIYLAGGMTVMAVYGKEKELSLKFKPWNRLYSYHYCLFNKIVMYNFKDLIKNKNSNNEKNQKTRITKRAGNS